MKNFGKLLVVITLLASTSAFAEDTLTMWKDKAAESGFVGILNNVTGNKSPEHYYLNDLADVVVRTANMPDRLPEGWVVGNQQDWFDINRAFLTANLTVEEKNNGFVYKGRFLNFAKGGNLFWPAFRVESEKGQAILAQKQATQAQPQPTVRTVIKEVTDPKAAAEVKALQQRLAQLGKELTAAKANAAAGSLDTEALNKLRQEMSAISRGLEIAKAASANQAEALGNKIAKGNEAVVTAIGANVDAGFTGVNETLIKVVQLLESTQQSVSDGSESVVQISTDVSTLTGQFQDVENFAAGQTAAVEEVLTAQSEQSNWMKGLFGLLALILSALVYLIMKEKKLASPVEKLAGDGDYDDISNQLIAAEEKMNMTRDEEFDATRVLSKEELQSVRRIHKGNIVQFPQGQTLANLGRGKIVWDSPEIEVSYLLETQITELKFTYAKKRYSLIVRPSVVEGSLNTDIPRGDEGDNYILNVAPKSLASSLMKAIEAGRLSSDSDSIEAL